MQLKTSLNFSISELSFNEVRLLAKTIKKGCEDLSKEEKNILLGLVDTIQDELIAHNLICAGCCDLENKIISKIVCPISKEPTTLCSDCLNARSKHVK